MVGQRPPLLIKADLCRWLLYGVGILGCINCPYISNRYSQSVRNAVASGHIEWFAKTVDRCAIACVTAAFGGAFAGSCSASTTSHP